MDFQKLMQTMRDIDSTDMNECGEMMAPPAQMSAPTQPATDAVPQPNMSVNFNAQGLDNIEGMMKLFRAVNPDMMPKDPAPLPAITAQPALNAEAYDNEPQETEFDMDDVLISGNDLHKEKGTYLKVAGGDNPMQRVGESINSNMRDSVLDILYDIQNITSAGGDATDNIADELGDLFSAVNRSDDSDLKTAYSMVRQAAEESPDVQDAAVARAIAMLTKADLEEAVEESELDDEEVVEESELDEEVVEESELDEPSSVSKYIKAVRDAIESGIVDPEIIESDFFDQMAAFDVDYDRIADHWDRITGGETIRKTPMQDKDIDRELAGFNRGNDEGVAATVDLDDLESGGGLGVDSTARASKKKDEKDPDEYLYKKRKDDDFDDEDEEDFEESFKNRLNSRLSTMLESMKK